jgi:bacterioferritin-associated ferredoxin
MGHDNPRLALANLKVSHIQRLCEVCKRMTDDDIRGLVYLGIQDLQALEQHLLEHQAGLAAQMARADEQLKRVRRLIAMFHPHEELYLFAQTDTRWADELVGGGPETFATHGGSVVTVAMAVSRLGSFMVSPLDANVTLMQVEAFRPDINWPAVNRAYPNIDIDYQSTMMSPLPANRLKRVVEAGGLVGLQVSNDQEGRAWVLAVGVDEVGEIEFIIVDAYDGAVRRMPPAYFRQTFSESVFAYVVFNANDQAKRD